MTNLPEIRPGHLLRLVDDVGIIQHACGTVPARSTGYCVDDVARLAIVALQLGLDRALERHRATRRHVAIARLWPSCCHAWESATHGMHNFMDYDRRWLDEPHHGDHVGRAAWALGEVVAAHPPRQECRTCLRLLTEMAPVLDHLTAPARWPSPCWA